MDDVGLEVSGGFFCSGRERGQVGRQHETTDPARTPEQAAAIRQPLHGLRPVPESVHLDARYGPHGRQPGIVRRQHRDVQPRLLFCVGQVEKKGRDVVPRIARERRGQMKHAHARSVTVWAQNVRARVG
jgi:hypothetical protein